MFRKKKSSRETKAHNPTKLFIPPIFTDSIAFLESNGTNVEGIFRLSASKDEIHRVMKAYDHKEAFKHLGFLDRPVVLTKITSDPHVVAGVLKQYLRDLPDSLLTIELYEPFISAIGIADYNIRMECVRRVLVHLPKINHEILSLLLRLLKKIANNSHITKMTTENLAICFAPTLIRSKDESFDTFIKDSERTNKLVSLLISDYEELFEKKPDPKPNISQNPGVDDFNQSMKKGVQKLAQKFIEKEKTETVIITEEEISEEQRRGFEEAFRVSKKKIKHMNHLLVQRNVEAPLHSNPPTPNLSSPRPQYSNNHEKKENVSPLPSPREGRCPEMSPRTTENENDKEDENSSHSQPISERLTIQQCSEMLLVGDSLALEYYLDTLDVEDRTQTVDAINAYLYALHIDHRII